MAIDLSTYTKTHHITNATVVHDVEDVPKDGFSFLITNPTPVARNVRLDKVVKVYIDPVTE